MNIGHLTEILAATAQAGFSLFLSLVLCHSAIPPPQGAVHVVIASCHSGAKVDAAWPTARHYELTHQWPPRPLSSGLFSPRLCANISPLFFVLYSVCLIQAARWVNAPTPLAGRASPSGRSQWGLTVTDSTCPCLLQITFRRAVHSLRLCFCVCPPADPSGKRLPDVKRTRCDERQMLWCKHIIVVKDRLAQWRFKGGGVRLFCCVSSPSPLSFGFNFLM